MKFTTAAVLALSSTSSAFVINTAANNRANNVALNMDWAALKGSQQMKPLPGSGGSGFGYTPAAAAPAPAAPAPVAAAPAPVAAAPADPFAAALAAYNQAATPAAPAPAAPVTPAFTEGSSVASGSVWASLAGSQQMKPLPGSSGAGFKTSSSAPAYSAPVAAAPVAAAPAPVAPVSSVSGGSSVASGSVWASLAGSQQMKPLPGSQGPGFKSGASSYTPPPAAAAPVAAAPVSSLSGGSSVASGSVWASLAGSQQMKPLPGSQGSGFQSGSSSYTPPPAAAAPVAAAPVAAAPVSSLSGGSSVASGSVWASLAGSQQMKPLPGSQGSGFKASSSAPSFSAPPAAAVPAYSAPEPVAPAPAAPTDPFAAALAAYNNAAPAASSPAPAASTGSSVASGSVWESLAGSQQMKPLPGSQGAGFR